ncbi:MAG: hypothetical protein UE295_06595 [Acutalibacteraceae bacterium]|nr:hypothetical protein [Acutalibacteraceae bacterium]
MRKISESTEEELKQFTDEAISQYTKASKPVFDNGKIYVTLHVKKRLAKKKLKKMLEDLK